MANIFNLDTGAGGGGKLTTMDIETKKIWQSDLVAALGPLYAATKRQDADL